MQGWQTNGSILYQLMLLLARSFVRVRGAMFSLNITRSPERSVMYIHSQIANNFVASTTKLSYEKVRSLLYIHTTHAHKHSTGHNNVGWSFMLLLPRHTNTKVDAGYKS